MRASAAVLAGLLFGACCTGVGAAAVQAPPPAAAGADVSLLPGQWEMVTRMTEIDAPGAPPEVLAQLRAAISEQRQTETICMTPEQARNPSRNMVAQGNNDSGCEFSETVFASGRIRVRASCRPPTAGAMELAMDGDFTATTINARIMANTEMRGLTGAGTQAMTMSGTLTGRRTGDCAR